jgi:hypothetical protein
VYSTNKASITAKVEAGFTDLFTSDSVEIRFSQCGYIACFCNFVQSSAGFTAGSFILDYDIEFFKPLLELNAVSISFAQASGFFTNPTTSNMYGTGLTLNPNNSINLGWVSSVQVQFTPQAGATYLILHRYETPTLSTNPAPNFTVASGVAPVINVNKFIGSSSGFVNWTNIQAKTSNPIFITQIQPLGNTPTVGEIFIQRANSSLTRKRETLESRMSRFEGLLEQFFTGKDVKEILNSEKESSDEFVDVSSDRQIEEEDIRVSTLRRLLARSTSPTSRETYPLDSQKGKLV